MKIIELLKDNTYYVQGFNTRLCVSYGMNNETTFQVYARDETGKYLMTLYSGHSEDDATSTFLTNEN